MKQNESVDIYLRFLKEQHSVYVSAIQNLLSALVGNDKELKKSASKVALDAGLLLRKNLANSDTPSWLKESINAINVHYKKFNDSGRNNALLNKLIPLVQQIKNHSWNFGNPNDHIAFDFDAIYNTCKKESKLDELFERITELLQKLVQSDDIDSIKIKTTLEKVIATIGIHSNASYLSLYSILDISKILIKNIMWEQLKALPGLGPIITGIEKTIEETDIEMDKLQKNMRNVIKQKFNSDFKLLEYKSSKILE